MTCRKTSFATIQIAYSALDAARETGHYDERYGVYLCVDCMKYHIGHYHSPHSHE